MPLDEIGQRYADGFYKRRLHEISATQQERIGALQNQHASQGSIRSSGYIREHYKLVLQDIDSLAQSKLEGLVKAYEKSGLPFDEAAFYDVKHQIVDFCHSEQHNLIGTMTQSVGQFLGGASFEPFAKEIISGIDAIIGRLVSELEIKRDETILEDRRTRKAYAAGLGKQWDAFICHASEDKQDFVDPFAHQLRDSGLSVWYDVFSLKLGDSLRRKIDEGLANSRYGIVILSKHFFAKEWPQNELDGLMSREIAGTKVILPIWHKIAAEEVRQYSPMLAGRVAAKSEHGLEKVIAEVRDAMGLGLEEQQKRIRDLDSAVRQTPKEAVRKAELKIHSYEKSSFTLVTNSQDRSQLRGMHVNLDMVVENRGNKGTTIHRYAIYVQETGKTYENLRPNLDFIWIQGRRCVRDIGNEPKITRDCLIRIEAETTTPRGFLPFFPLDAPIQTPECLHCRLTLIDMEGNEVSQDFELREV